MRFAAMILCAALSACASSPPPSPAAVRAAVTLGTRAASAALDFAATSREPACSAGAEPASFCARLARARQLVSAVENGATAEDCAELARAALPAVRAILTEVEADGVRVPAEVLAGLDAAAAFLD